MSSGIDEIVFKKFIAELNAEVSTRRETEASGLGEIRPEEALAQVVLEQLEEEGITVDAQLCPFEDTSGRRRCAISALAITEDEDRLDLFLAKYVEDEGDFPTLAASVVGELAGKAARFFDYASKGEWDRFAATPETMDAARRVHGALKRLSSVRVFILTNAVARERDVDDLEIAGILLRFEIVDAERLFRLSGNATSRSDIEIDFVALLGRPLSCLEMVPRAPEYDTYLAIFPGKLLFDLYERYGQRLFEFNVRSFLQAKGKVNKGIRDTLRDSPDRFMAYNNGVVATADHLEVGLSNGEMVISKISGLQIVNGAQTTASLYRAKKVDKIDLGRVSIAVKITKVAAEKLQEFVPLISRFANTQNVIQVADLSANNDFHIQMERLSGHVWCPGEETRWFYERARGSYEDALQREGSTPTKRREFKRVTPSNQKITKTDLARYLIAWMGRPHTVSMGAQKNFAVFMAELPELFPPNWQPDADFYRRCIAQAILFRACERIVRTQKFAAYRANIAVYTYSLLSHISMGELNFDRVWTNQEVSDELERMLTDWTRRVDATIRESAGAKNVTEWCKKAECWEAVRSLGLKISSEPPELVKKEPPVQRPSSEVEERKQDESTQSATSSLDEEAVEECMKYDATTWAKLNFWGVSTNALDYYERGVAHTLSEYAALQWVKRPSIKQARIGLRVLRRGRDEKLI
ncbi:MAG TPA: AIPR family protein [Usitatibacter sp.]|nr:AIPR family protein [Usitatibacter sp.]